MTTKLEYRGLRFASDRKYEVFMTAIAKLNNDDCYYASLAYCIATTGKIELLQYLHDHAVEIDKIKRTIRPYSPSEKYMIQLGLQMFNSNNCRSLQIDDVFSYIVSWQEELFNVLAFRYGRGRS